MFARLQINFAPLEPVRRLRGSASPARYLLKALMAATPTVLLLDGDGKERVRLEGYLPNNDFVAALMSGLGRIAFLHKKYADAERGILVRPKQNERSRNIRLSFQM